MKRLSEEVISFFQNAGFVILTTIDDNGRPHSACKGIVKIEPSGKIYLLDLYSAKTYENLRENPNISITAVNEDKFKGYCLKGKARMMPEGKFNADLSKAWEERITTRITQRVLRNIRGEEKLPHHPEALLPKPEYLIVMDVDEIVDLTPHHLRK